MSSKRKQRLRDQKKLKGCVPPRLQSSWECLRDRKNTGLGGEPRPTMDQIWPSEKKVGNVQITYQKARCILRVGRQPGDPTSRENKHYHKYELAKAKHWWINRCPWSTLETSGLSRVRLLHTHGLQHTSFPELAQTHVHWVGDAIQPSHSLSSTSPLPYIFPSIRVFSNEFFLHIRQPKYCSFSFSISPSNGYSGLISFRINWMDLQAVQGTLKSLIQPHISKASIFQCSTFFLVQLSHPYMTTGKNIALTRRTKVMSLAK